MKLRHKITVGAISVVPLLVGGAAYASSAHLSTSLKPTASVSTLTTPAGSEQPASAKSSEVDVKGGANIQSGANLQGGLDVKGGADSTSSK